MSVGILFEYVSSPSAVWQESVRKSLYRRVWKCSLVRDWDSLSWHDDEKWWIGWYDYFKIKFGVSENSCIFAVPFREHSSVGLEHLPYKQRVGGSTPSAPTRTQTPFYDVERRFSFSTPMPEKTRLNVKFRLFYILSTRTHDFMDRSRFCYCLSTKCRVFVDREAQSRRRMVMISV